MPCAHAPVRTPYPQAPNGHLKIRGGCNLDDTEIEQSEEELDNENLIRYYCYKGFQYKDIGMFLQRKHGQKMNLWTLKNGDPCKAMDWTEGMHNMT